MINLRDRCARFFIALFVYSFVFVHIAHSSVVLNEIGIQPDQTVELYNTSSESADISSWYIDDAGGATYYTIPQNTILPGLSCSIFSSDFNFNKSSSDTVRLFDSTSPPISSSAKLIENYSYAKAPEIYFSFSKKPDGGAQWLTAPLSLGLLNESLLSCIPLPSPTPSPTETPTPTPTQPPTQIPLPTDAITPTTMVEYGNIYLSEIYGYPFPDEHEWVELYNDNDFTVQLTHWYMDDGMNTGSVPKEFSLAIQPHAYATIELSSSLFNNDADVVRLLDSNKNERDSMEYEGLIRGKSMGRISFTHDSYCHQEPSKNNSNTSCLLSSQSPTQQPSQNTIQKKQSPTQTIKAYPYKPQQKEQQKIADINNTVKIPADSPGEVLGLMIEQNIHPTPAPYLCSISFFYSLLTIISIFIKMKNAQI